jgi:hypothetical protein
MSMLTRSLRWLTVAVALVALALPAASLAGSQVRSADRGVVQSVDTGQIVLRALDGGVVSFSVLPGTVVRLNGSRATIADVRPGFVARVVHDARAHALRIEAFGAPAATTDRGLVTAISKSSITLRLAGGGGVTLALDANTRFRLHGVPSRRQLARPGAQVTVTHAADAPATVVNVLKRAGA